MTQTQWSIFKPRTVQVVGGLRRLEYGGCWKRSRTRGREVDWEVVFSRQKEGQCLGTRSRGDEKGGEKVADILRK